MSIATGSGKRTITPAGSMSMPEATKGPKVSTPETFDGTPGRLEAFQLQVQLYLYFNTHQFYGEASKVLYAASFLRGRAARGFRPYLKDWLSNQDEGESPKTETRKIFHDYDEFENKLNDLYGIPNEEVYADRHIRQLRQTTSVSLYASEFQGYAADLEWNDAALRSQFYLGLKDTVKSELSRNSSLTTLGAMIKSAKEIDERLQELRHDRFVQPGFQRPARGGRGSFKARSDDPYGPRPMELDATERGGRHKKAGWNPTCYACGNQGHIASNCKDRNKVRREEFNFLSRKETYQACENIISTSVGAM